MSTVELLYMLIDLLSLEEMLLRVIGKEITARTTGDTQTRAHSVCTKQVRRCTITKLTVAVPVFKAHQYKCRLV